MALLGFIFCLLILLYLSAYWAFAVLGTIALTGKLDKGSKIAGVIGFIILAYGWYWLFKDVTFNIGGI